MTHHQDEVCREEPRRLRRKACGLFRVVLFNPARAEKLRTRSRFSIIPEVRCPVPLNPDRRLLARPGRLDRSCLAIDFQVGPPFPYDWSGGHLPPKSGVRNAN